MLTVPGFARRYFSRAVICAALGVIIPKANRRSLKCCFIKTSVRYAENAKKNAQTHLKLALFVADVRFIALTTQGRSAERNIPSMKS